VPPYKKVVSQAQAHKVFALAEAGKMSMSDAKGKVKGVDVKHLPKYVGSHRDVHDKTIKHLDKHEHATRGGSKTLGNEL
jgi:hypothetical protein